MELRASMSGGQSVERRAAWRRSHWCLTAAVCWLGQGHQSVSTETIATAPPKKNAHVLQEAMFCPKWPCATTCSLVSADWTKGWHRTHERPIHRLASHPCRWSNNDLSIQIVWLANLTWQYGKNLQVRAEQKGACIGEMSCYWVPGLVLDAMWLLSSLVQGGSRLDLHELPSELLAESSPLQSPPIWANSS